MICLEYEAKEIIKNKRTGKVYESKEAFDADVNDPNTDTTGDDFRQDLEATLRGWSDWQKQNNGTRSATEIQHELLEKYVSKDLLDKFQIRINTWESSFKSK